MKSVVVVVSVVLMMGSAHAQAQSPEPEPDAVRPDVALLLSLGGTLAAYGLLAGGIASANGAVVGAGAVATFVMPSAGRWYAHRSGFGGLAFRLVGTGTAIAGFVVGFNLCFAGLFDHTDDRSCNKNENTAMALMALGGVTYVGATVYDIIRAPLDARAYNEAQRARPVAIVPVVAPAQHQYGLALAGQF